LQRSRGSRSRASGTALNASGNGSSTLIPRLVLGSLLATAILIPYIYHPLIRTVYTNLYNSSFYRLSTFETIETLLCYAIIEPLFTYKFGHSPSRRIDVRNSGAKPGATTPKLPRMKRPTRRLHELLIYAAPLLFLDLTLIKKYTEVPLSAIRTSGGYSPIPPTATAIPKISSSFLAPTIHHFTPTSPLQLTRALPPTIPSSRRLVLELATSLIIYDTLFFAIHIAFHTLAFLRRVHAPHHKHAEMHPQVTNNLSVVERVSLILLANFSLNIIGAHVLTRTLFVPVFVWLLVEVHCGLDLEWGYHRILPRGWGAGSAAHARHHRTGEGGYQPFFAWWDGLVEWWGGDVGRRKGRESARAR